MNEQMRRPRLRRWVLVMSALILPCQVAAQDARTIVAEAQRRNQSKSQHYEGVLQVFDAKGTIADKRWTLDRIGSHGDSKTVLRFTQPAEVKGVALLVANHPDRASDQWMWTPGIERDRRIALQDRSTRFFGTDFSFEDLEERDVDQYDHTLLGEEAIDDAVTWKIQSIPKPAQSSQYTKTIAWIRKDNYATARIDSYVIARVVRRLEFSDIREVQGIWTATDTLMTDLQRGSATRLTLDKVQFNLPLKDDEFTVQALRRQ